MRRHLDRPKDSSYELFLARVAERELGLPVIVYDTGELPSLYDLQVQNAGAPSMAIECVRCVDSKMLAAFNALEQHHDRLVDWDLEHNWSVHALYELQIRNLRRELEPILQSMERAGIEELWPGSRFDRIKRGKYRSEHLLELGIRSLTRNHSDGSGRVIVWFEGDGGAIPHDDGSSLCGWISETLTSPTFADVMSKLSSSQLGENHVFFLIGLRGVPFHVWSYSMHEHRGLPVQNPTLPRPVTGIWIAFQFGNVGMRWHNGSWSRFSLAF